MAAAVFVPPSPHDPFSKMANSARRMPLASLSNATNSPHRLLTNSGSKRPRSIANLSQQENEPPQKRLAVDKSAKEAAPATPRRMHQTQPTMPEARVFERGHGDSGPNAFQRKLVAVRDKSAGLRVTKNVENPSKEDSIRAWQKHYRKLFPTFSFYFDGVSEDARARFLRQITNLGAVCWLSNVYPSVEPITNIAVERREVLLKSRHSHRYYSTYSDRRKSQRWGRRRHSCRT